MKKASGYLLILTFAAFSFAGCARKTSTGILGGGTTGAITKTVVTVVGAILLAKLVQSLLKNVLGNASFASFSQDKSLVNSIDENTPLNKIAGNEILASALQLLVAQKYQIPFNKVSNSYSSFNTVGDLATFIGQNGSAESLSQLK